MVTGLAGAGLWLWMALANRRGQSWARIASTVLFGIYTLGALIGSMARLTLTAPNGSDIEVPVPVAGILVTWAVWLIGLGAVIALWRPATGDHYAVVSRLQPASLVGYPGPAYGLPPYAAAPMPYGYRYLPPAPPRPGAAAPGSVLSPSPPPGGAPSAPQPAPPRPP